MQVAKCLADLHHCAGRLRQILRTLRVIQQEPVHTPHSSSHRTFKNSQRLPDILLLSSQHPAGEKKNNNSLRRAQSSREKLLLRQVPITLSRLERYMWMQRKKRQRHYPTSCATPEEVGNHSQQLAEQRIARELRCGNRTSTSALVKLNECPATHNTNDLTNNAINSKREWISLLLSRSETTPVIELDNKRRHSIHEVQATQILLSHLHFFEGERLKLYRIKQRQLDLQLQKAHQSFAELKHMRRQHVIRPPTMDKDGQADVTEKKTGIALWNEAQQSVKTRLKDLEEDRGLLKSSLLARPLVSARLWKLLLQEHIWVAAVHHQRAHNTFNGGTPQTEISRSSGGDDTAKFFLFGMALSLARLTLGVLKEYVSGSEVSRVASRFVVSAPSAKWKRQRREQQQQVREVSTVSTVAPESDGETSNEDGDLLFHLLQDNLPTPAEPSAVTKSSHVSRPGLVAHASRSKPRVRWLPSHSASVLPLVLETLALQSLLLPELPVEDMVRSGCAEELANYMVTLQKTATVVLTLRQSSISSTAEARGKEEEDKQALHRVLWRLQDSLLSVSARLKSALADVIHADQLPPIPSSKAARLLIELQSLQQLRRREKHSDVILSHFVLDIFPQLRTNTRSVLLEKTRQSSLLAFSTRRHREKLHQHHGKAGAEQLVLGSVIQQARLQRRMLAAALRVRHITEVHHQLITELGQQLAVGDLTTLVQLLSISAVEADHAASPATRSTGTAAGTRDSLITAALFAAEALIASATVRSPLELDESSGASESSARGGFLPMADLSRFWLSLVELWPLIDTRRDLLMQHARHARGLRQLASTGGGNAAQTETLILGCLTEMVLHGINAELATRLQELAVRRELSSHVMKYERRRGDSQVGSQRSSTMLHPKILAQVASGLSQWQSSGPVGSSKRPALLTQQVHLTAKLVRDVFFGDAEMLNALRQWSAQDKSAYAQIITEAFDSMGLLDTTTSAAVLKACRPHEIPVKT